MKTSASFIRIDPATVRPLSHEADRLRRVVCGDLNVGRRTDIGQAWDGLHFLLSPRRRAGARHDTGDAFGLGLFGGRRLNGYAIDDGELINYADPDAVARVDRELQRITGDGLLRRYDPGAMDVADVEPGDWQTRGDEGFELLLDAFLQWRELYHLAAEDGQGVLCLLRHADDAPDREI
ncbi:MAG: hypothetical protein BIFFINMI_02653 [Phycisphaerae bacterium]|nr:hypothetical protein [Phycisphaerae bacterium]